MSINKYAENALILASGATCLYYGLQGETLKVSVVPLAGCALSYTGRRWKIKNVEKAGLCLSGTGLITIPGSITAYSIQYIRPGNQLVAFTTGALISIITLAALTYLLPTDSKNQEDLKKINHIN